MSSKIRILLIEPGKDPREENIEHSLSTFQNIVGGYIEALEFGEVILICNEEGKILNLPFNRDLGCDVIFGNIILVGSNKLGDFISLTDNQIEKYKKKFEIEIIGLCKNGR